jgi:LCP family protein required for cell wall assembly
MKKILSLSLIFALFWIPSLRAKADDCFEKSVERYLVVGFDDAAQNTDVIAVISYHHATHRLTILQIPRDTYYRFGNGQNKLNQLYPHLLSGSTQKDAKKEAMHALTQAVSSMLGVTIDRYVGVSITEFEEMIDRIGGVPMAIDRDISYTESGSEERILLPKGFHVLNGRQASAFVRYRIGYPTADIGRIDAQKAFVSALLRKFGTGLSYRTVVSILAELRDGTVSDLPLALALRCGLRFVTSYSKTDIRYLTLPGEACLYRGISYYVVNRTSCEEAISKWLCFDAARPQFDMQHAFVLESAESIAEIYHRNSVPYVVYTDADLRLGS